MCYAKILVVCGAWLGTKYGLRFVEYVFFLTHQHLFPLTLGLEVNLPIKAKQDNQFEIAEIQIFK